MKGSHTDYGEETKEEGGWELGVPAAGDGDVGGGFRGDGRVFSEE